MSEPILRRSTLILPAHVPRFVDKAHTRGADAVCLDLEDSVPPQLKGAARAALTGAIPAVSRGGADVMVRVNNNWELIFSDLDAAVVPGVTCIKIPKVEKPEDLHAIDRLIEDRERRQGMEPGGLQLAIALETALGVLRAREIAGASRRVRAISSATEDFATDLEVELSDEGTELFFAKAYLVLVAREFELEPIGLVGRVADYTDLEAFRQSALRAKRIGYRGANCIHPDQVAILNEVFSPTEAEINRAQAMVDAGRAATEAGRGAFGVGGQMADIPTVLRAERVLRRAALIAARRRPL